MVADWTRTDSQLADVGLIDLPEPHARLAIP